MKKVLNTDINKLNWRFNQIFFSDHKPGHLLYANTVFIASYIPPYNSFYLDECYYNNLILYLNHFRDSHIIYIVGDLNSKLGNKGNYDGTS